MPKYNPFKWLKDRRKRKQETKANLLEDERRMKQVVETLQNVPLFASLSTVSICDLAGQFTDRVYKQGETIIKKGDQGTDFFIITEGTAQIIVDDNNVVTLVGFDYFGEQALLRETTRNATIKATSDLECLVLNYEQFNELTKSTDIMFAQRGAILASDLSKFKVSGVNEDLTAEQMDFIHKSIAENILFCSHPDSVVDHVVPHFFERKYKMGDVIIKEGDLIANEFFVIKEGNCSVKTKKNGETATLTSGQCFGEVAMMYKAPRNASIEVMTDECSVYVLERNTFRHIIISKNEQRDEEELAFLKSVKLLQPLLSHELILLQHELVSRKYEGGELIFKQGDDSDKFYIIKEGSCSGTSKHKGKTVTFVLQKTHFFGDLGLLENGAKRTATITVDDNGCTLLELSSQEFKELLGPLTNILKRNADELKKPEAERKFNLNQSAKICGLDEFKVIGLLGRGAFGKVQLVVDPNTTKSYALKAIKKTQICELGQSSHIVNEKNVMGIMNNRFLVNLRNTYKDAWRVYFLVDVCLGGELFTILRKKKSFTEDETRFYVGCVVEAFSYMHGMDIIYRDLKPENIVMDSNGYVKVTDFGFAKIVRKKTYTLCGTPDYLAPEIVTGQGHGKPVDWWCVGVLIYELLSSFPPFFDDEPMGTYRKIIQAKFKFPKYFTSDSRDLIARLLRTKPTKRLAVLKGGADNIRQHNWYSGFIWETLRDGTQKPPFVPVVKSVDDLSNFQNRDRKPSAADIGKAPLTPWDVDF